MKKNAVMPRFAGFTLVEICISLLVLSLVGGVAYSMLINSTMLLAKNVSLNSSSTILRSALDRMFSEINQANGLPTLFNINPDGSITVVTIDPVTGLTPPAAGIFFDRYIGGPYIVGNPGTGLPATTTSFNLYYSGDPLASPPVPAANDVVIMDGSARPIVAASPVPIASSTLTGPVPVPSPTPGKMVTVSLPSGSTLGNYTNPQGAAISWTSTSQQTAYLVHREAFAVVPVNGGRAELRMYKDAEAVTNYNTASYVVLTREIGTQTRLIGTQTVDESKPFQIVAKDDVGEQAGIGSALGASFLRIAMRVEDQQFNNYLKSRYSATNQAKEFNTFLRIDTRLRPRNFIH